MKETIEHPEPCIIAFDPSLSCTGWAVVSLDGTRILNAGVMDDDAPKDASAWERANSISEHAMDLVESWAKHGRSEGDSRCSDVRAVVVEQPRTNGMGLRGQRSAATAPNYGIVVGVVTKGLDMLRSGYGYELLTPSASDWTRGYPGTKDDGYKTRRVAFVASIFGVPCCALGPKTKAGNVADAVLLGYWASGRVGTRKVGA